MFEPNVVRLLGELPHEAVVLDVGASADIDCDEIRFLPKYHFIHSDWRFNLPNACLRSRQPEAAVQWLWWNGHFRFSEMTIHGLANQERVRATYGELQPPASWLEMADEG